MSNKCKKIISKLIVLTIVSVLAGCNAAKTINNDEFTNMRDVYDEVTNGKGKGKTGFDEVRVNTQERETPWVDSPGDEHLASYTRTVQNEIDSLFKRLPNPTIYLFVDPHLAGAQEVPVPGYTTSFTMYEHDHWALPNEAPVPAQRQSIVPISQPSTPQAESDNDE